MANTPRPTVREPTGRDARPWHAADAARHRAELDGDPRVARTTRALGRALIALLEEQRAFDAITVQNILDRAGVGRTAFYAHYRNKHDVLHSSYEGLLASFEGLLDRPSPPGAPGARLFPVTEFLGHIGDREALVRALRRDGLLDDTWALLAGHAARVIGRRLGPWAAAAGGVPAATLAALPTALVARMLAGALVESITWWQDHPGAAAPAAVDAAFHTLARGVLRQPRGESPCRRSFLR